jgi:hypothetical protein
VSAAFAATDLRFCVVILFSTGVVFDCVGWIRAHVERGFAVSRVHIRILHSIDVVVRTAELFSLVLVQRVVSSCIPELC